MDKMDDKDQILDGDAEELSSVEQLRQSGVHGFN